MTDETPSSPAAASTPAAAAPATPATPAAPAAAATPPATPATPASPQTPPAGAEPAKPWQVAEAYKDKPWASKIKSEEDLYKQVDNLTGLVGKKIVTAADLAGKSPEEQTAFYDSLRPAEKTAYKFGDEGTFDQAFTGSVADMLFDAGISEHQANKLIPAYQKVELARLQEATSEEGFTKIMKENFGDKYDAVVAGAANSFKKHLSEKNQQTLDVIPNAYLPAVYELVQKYEAEITAMKKEYGVTENGDAHLNKGGGIVPPDITKVRSDLRKQIAEIDRRPHTAAEKQKLVDELQKTYEGKK